MAEMFIKQQPPQNLSVSQRAEWLTELADNLNRYARYDEKLDVCVVQIEPNLLVQIEQILKWIAKETV